MKQCNPKSQKVTKDVIEERARRNLGLWSWLFAGTAQVPIRELWNWPLRMGLEMAAARRLYDAEMKKLEAQALEDAQRETGEGSASKPWWETSLGVR